MANIAYKRIAIDFPITPELDKAIEDLLKDWRENNGRLEDCYRSEILFWLKDALQRKIITREQYEMLKDYYVLDGIYEQGGDDDGLHN